MGYTSSGLYWHSGLSNSVSLGKGFFQLQGRVNTAGLSQPLEGWYMHEVGTYDNTAPVLRDEVTGERVVDDTWSGRAQWFVVVMRPGDDKPRHFTEEVYRNTEVDCWTLPPSYSGVRIGKDYRKHRPPAHVLPEMERMYAEAKADADALLNALVVTSPEEIQAQVVAKLTDQPWDLEKIASDKKELIMQGWSEMLDKAHEGDDTRVEFSTEINSVQLSFTTDNSYRYRSKHNLHYAGKMPSLFANRHLVHAQVEQWCRMLRVGSGQE